MKQAGLTPTGPEVTFEERISEAVAEVNERMNDHTSTINQRLYDLESTVFKNGDA